MQDDAKLIETMGKRWGENLSAEQWREIAGRNLDAAAEERRLRLIAEEKLSTLSRDREDIRREAFDEAAKVVERASEYSFCCADGWTGGNVRKMLAERIRALKETPA